jgi:hypothetical protein
VRLCGGEAIAKLLDRPDQAVVLPQALLRRERQHGVDERDIGDRGRTLGREAARYAFSIGRHRSEATTRGPRAAAGTGGAAGRDRWAGER